MAGYGYLLEELVKLKANVANFRKVILHSHSTDSYDYVRLEKKDGIPLFETGKDKLIIEQDYIKNLEKIDLDMLAITDRDL